MDDLLIVLVGCLSAVTIVCAFEYYRRLRGAQAEYEKAKGSVEDIVLSFNRQFKREGDRLEAVAYKVEANASRGDNALAKMEDIDRRLGVLYSKSAMDSEDKEKILASLSEVEKKVCDIAASQDSISTRLSSLEQQTRQLPILPEPGLEAAIPIRREKAISQLTNTELSVLEMLASEGAKTAPEVKERVKLSREHTARLMKKLYEEGYLEREIGKIPFKYSVKKEMEKLLKKPSESQTV